MMSKFYLGTNWKMTKTLDESLDYCKELVSIFDSLDQKKIELFIIPSYTALLPIKNEIKKTNIRLGAQNMHWEERGEYTGEISPLMLNEIGIEIVELGHSERREYFNENDEDINKKVHAALKFNMKALICIGEKLEEKENDISVEVLERQIKICLKDITVRDLDNILLAYEPVWAIGKNGIPATVDYVSLIHREIRRILKEMFGYEGINIPILYGGSINLDNFISFLKEKNINGLFIGRSAWDIGSFKKIVLAINSEL